MIIETKYNRGDKVKYTGKKLVDKTYVCGFCNGTGTALDWQGCLVECPECEGTGGFTKEEYEPVERMGVIETIMIDAYLNSLNRRLDIKYIIRGDHYSETVYEDKVHERIES